MATLLWLKSPDGIHNNYGLEMMTTDKYTAENFLYNQGVPMAEKYNLHHFIQGLSLKDRGTSWVYLEFWTSNYDNILSMVDEMNRHCVGYYQNEVYMQDPTRELLKELQLM